MPSQPAPIPPDDLVGLEYSIVAVTCSLFVASWGC
jgi:hypothetical protein